MRTAKTICRTTTRFARFDRRNRRAPDLRGFCVTLASLTIQLLNGLASSSALFLVAAGLTLIFGVTRIVNFAHGSLYMLGAYLAYSIGATFAALLGPGPFAFWGGALLAALCVAAIGA